MSKKLQIFFFLLCSVYSMDALGDNSKIIKSDLKEATIFFNGAELTHIATANLIKGENLIKIEGLSPDIDRNSIKISTTGGVLISSYEFSVDYLSESKTNPSIKKLQDSLDYYTTKLTQLKTEIKINTDLTKMLESGTNKNISGSEKGLGIDELVKTMEYYKNKSNELESIKSKQQKCLQEINKSLDSLQKQLLQESLKNNKSSGILNLNLSSPLSTSCNLVISYYTRSASWMPYYDINISDTEKPIQIASKAKVRQTTGLDWEKVKLSLATATPSNGKIAPLFTSWFLSPIQEAIRDLRLSLDDETNLVQNSYFYEKEASPIMMESSESKTKKTSYSPLYIVNDNVISQQEFESIDQSIIKETKFINAKNAVRLYGEKASAGIYIVSLKNSMDDYTSVSDNDLNMTINIAIPFSVPGNGKEQSIDLQTQKATASYKYYCAPKLDTETYLLAEIADWEKLNLMSGKANITYNGTYVGETVINASSTHKNLSLTLGAEKRVNVKREKMQDFSSKRFLNNDIKQVFTYKLTVRNNQNKTIKMTLKDQYPTSTQKDIEVELLKENTTPWTARIEELGVITWEEEFKPGETKEYTISYSVKYPKNINLNL